MVSHDAISMVIEVIVLMVCDLRTLDFLPVSDLVLPHGVRELLEEVDILSDFVEIFDFVNRRLAP